MSSSGPDTTDLEKHGKHDDKEMVFHASDPARMWKYGTIALIVVLVIVVLAFAGLFTSLGGSSSSSSCTTPPSGLTAVVQLILVNDVFEMDGVSSSSLGGIARLSTFKKQLLADNPNTYMILAGSTLSGSPLTNSTYAPAPSGKLAGRQMVDVWNLASLDFATFGDDDFNIAGSDMQACIDEASGFKWFSSNVQIQGRNLPTSISVTTTASSASPAVIKVAFIAFTDDENEPNYVEIANQSESIMLAQQLAASLKQSNQLLVAVTHWEDAEDDQLASLVPQIDIILRGHDFDNSAEVRGDSRTNPTYIYTSDSNARNVQLLTITYDLLAHTYAIAQSLVQISPANYGQDPVVEQRVQYWLNLQYPTLAPWNPTMAIATIPQPTAAGVFDGLQSSVRAFSTPFTTLVLQSFLTASRSQGFSPDLSMFNAGASWFGDVFPAGATVFQYDVLRTFPYGGNVITAAVQGMFLRAVLSYGMLLQNTDSYLQVYPPVTGWLPNIMFNGAPINATRTYIVAMNDGLLSPQVNPWFAQATAGTGWGSQFFTLLSNFSTQVDVRAALISGFASTYPLAQ